MIANPFETAQIIQNLSVRHAVSLYELLRHFERKAESRREREQIHANAQVVCKYISLKAKQS